MKIDWLPALFALALGTLLLSSLALAEAPRAIAVPAGNLVEALEALAKQTDANLIYQPRQLRGMQTKGVSGTLTVREAVQALVRGSGLQMTVDEASGAVLISAPATDRPRTSS